VPAFILGAFGQFQQKMGLRRGLSDMENAVMKIMKNLTVNALFKSDMIEVSYKDPDPREAAHVLGVLLDAYVQKHVEIFQAYKALKALEEQADFWKGKLEDVAGIL
jgi:uncharacterized protein involved in exopolysaccharide biosynthesis